jgi:hypothetical protein
MEKLTQECKYKRFVMPTLTYAAETRADITKAKQILKTIKMTVLRNIMGKQGLTM